MNIKYYICSYSDYSFQRRINGATKFKKLSMSHTVGKERKSIDGTKFIVWCSMDSICNGMLKWMNGNEKEYSQKEILKILSSDEWTDYSGD